MKNKPYIDCDNFCREVNIQLLAVLVSPPCKEIFIETRAAFLL